jgi:hypothetical protein
MKKGTTETIAGKGVREMRAEYDFGGAIRGKHAEQVARDSNVVVIEPDVAQVFPDSKSVNEALRALMPLIVARRRTAKQAKQD